MQNSSPFFTVIIPTYNRWPMLDDAIDSVLGQSFKDFELIVVDDGSTDDTAERIAELSPDIRFVTRRNGGVSAARNTGIRIARGKWLAFLDSDDTWLQQKLSQQHEYITQNPDAMVLHSDEIWWRGGKRVNPGARHRKACSGDEGMDHAFERSLEMCLISPSSVVMSKTVFEKVGVFDENLPACEDYDMWLRTMIHFPIHHQDCTLSVKRNADSQEHGASQLSASIWGLDRYRVTSLEKLITDVHLPPDWRAMALNQIVRKADIIAKGCVKRGRLEEADQWQGKSDLALRLLGKAT